MIDYHFRKISCCCLFSFKRFYDSLLMVIPDSARRFVWARSFPSLTVVSAIAPMHISYCCGSQIYVTYSTVFLSFKLINPCLKFIQIIYKPDLSVHTVVATRYQPCHSGSRRKVILIWRKRKP